MLGFIVNCTLMNCPRSLWSSLYSREWFIYYRLLSVLKSSMQIFLIINSSHAPVNHVFVFNSKIIDFFFSFFIYLLFIFLCNIAMCLLKFISFVLLFSCNYLFLHSFHFNFILPSSLAPSSSHIRECSFFFRDCIVTALHCTIVNLNVRKA